MKLDSRILEGKKPLDCFDTEIAKQFIGKKGYFSHYIDNYADLKNTVLGTLGSAEDTFNGSFGCIEEPNDNYYYEFFMPAEWVKPEEPEKKYRAFTLNEFVNQYSLGDEIIMRSKDNPTSKHVLFVGYKEGGDDVLLGQYWNTFMILFNNYELHTSEGWKPFGIEE